MKAADRNPLASTFVVLVILFAGMVMAAGGRRTPASPIGDVKTAPAESHPSIKSAASFRKTAERPRPTAPEK